MTYITPKKEYIQRTIWPVCPTCHKRMTWASFHPNDLVWYCENKECNNKVS